MANIFEDCLNRAKETEENFYRQQKCRVYRWYGRKIEQAGETPSICYKILTYNRRGDAFRSLELIDIDDRHGPGWWRRCGAGRVDHPAKRREYASKWVFDDDYEPDLVEAIV